MAFDEKLADRIRKVLNGTRNLEEKKMFGGVKAPLAWENERHASPQPTPVSKTGDPVTKIQESFSLFYFVDLGRYQSMRGRVGLNDRL